MGRRRILAEAAEWSYPAIIPIKENTRITASKIVGRRKVVSHVRWIVEYEQK